MISDTNVISSVKHIVIIAVAVTTIVTGLKRAKCFGSNNIFFVQRGAGVSIRPVAPQTPGKEPQVALLKGSQALLISSHHLHHYIPFAAFDILLKPCAVSGAHCYFLCDGGQGLESYFPQWRTIAGLSKNLPPESL